MKIAHVINPVNVSESSDLYYAQPITFESMLRAKSYANSSVEVDLFAICYEEDLSIVPEGFIQLPNLSKSVLDYGEFKKQKKLPLIKDILTPFLEKVNYDFIIYTNVDIALMPQFYNYIYEKVSMGNDAMIINRRVITNYEGMPLDVLYSVIGGEHAGYDCFVFKQSVLKNYILGQACIGANWIGRAMFLNLLAFSSKMEIIKNDHLTFHLGEDGEWLKGQHNDYDLHNRDNVKKIISKLSKSVNDTDKLKEFEDVSKYMDEWYAPVANQSENRLPVETSLFNKVKKKLKRMFK